MRYKENKIYKNKSGDYFKVVSIFSEGNYSRMVVIFAGYEDFPQVFSTETRTLKNRFKPSVYNVGYLGDIENTAPHYEELRLRWKAMIGRCYDSEHARFNCYGGDGIYVCKDWLNFSNFYRWITTEMKLCNITDLNYGIHVDKDLLMPGCRMYSPSTCVLLPFELNNFLKRRVINSDTGYAGIGKYSKCTIRPYFFTRTREDGTQYKEYFSSLEDAHDSYVKHFYERKEFLLQKYDNILREDIKIRIRNIKLEDIVIY